MHNKRRLNNYYKGVKFTLIITTQSPLIDFLFGPVRN